LESARAFQEVLIWDTGSTDRTVEIAQEFPNVKVHRALFEGFGKTHNSASHAANCDWILSLDGDEVLSEPLVQEILSLSLDPSCVYAILRHNFLNQKRIKWCGGWHPDWVDRLYHRKHTKFSDAPVHEKILLTGMQEVRLTHPLLHFPYLEIGDFLNKMQIYSSLFAEQHKGKKNTSFFGALWHSWFAFAKSYFLKRGFLGGKEGLMISLYNGHSTFYKYLKLMESNTAIKK
jgi:glycosyltransferase involved in cell wall biosynthesis